MADVAKYHLVSNTNINNNNIVTDIKSHFPFFKTRKSSHLLYGVVLVFVVFTLFLAFTPTSSSSSPWFISFFTVNSTSPSNNFSDESYRSHFNSVFSYFFSNSSQLNSSRSDNFIKQSNQSDVLPQIPQDNTFRSKDVTKSQVPTSQNSSNSQFSPLQDQNFETKQSNQSVLTPSISQNIPKSQVPISDNAKNLTKSQVPISDDSTNLTKTQAFEQTGENLSHQSCKNETCSEQKQSTVVPHMPQNWTSLSSDSAKKGNESKIQGNGVVSGDEKKKQEKGGDDLIATLLDCDLYDGEWVRDESYPLYKPGSCPLIDEQFNCIRNGRPDSDYHKLKWKPKGCTLPRLSGDHMLKFLKGKRLVFVGDSLNRNMWESLVCILRNSVENKKNVYEAYGRHYFRNEISYSFIFKDYNFTVEFFVAPFLVQEWEVKNQKGENKETLRLDLIIRDNDQFKDADFLVFNTGHWWTHEKTSKGEDYYQEGSHVYKQLDVMEAFRKAMTTWVRWVDANVNPNKTHVLFRGYSATHFSGGQWNSGGQCDSETEPIRNNTYLMPYPWKMTVFESVVKGMRTPISYLNITTMTDYRKDGHPSIYRKQHVTNADEEKAPLRFQDCSHWCLPGVPDSWNELLFAELVRKQYKDQHQKNKW